MSSRGCGSARPGARAKGRVARAAVLLGLAAVLILPLFLVGHLPGPANHGGGRGRLWLRAGVSRTHVSNQHPSERGGEISGKHGWLVRPGPDHGIPVWVFFYLWYGNPDHDGGKYWHWTHPILPHWDAKVTARYPKGIIEAPDRVASPGGVRPRRGLYSSRDPETLSGQMSELSRAGVTGAIVSWWGQTLHDDNGPTTEPVHMKLAFEAAEKHGIKISVHLEPYKGRTAESTCEDLSFLLNRYGHSPAWDPRIYVYDSYLTSADDWKQVMSRCSARKEVKLVALILKPNDVHDIAPAFDGVYTYFAATGFTKASDPSSWQSIADSASRAGLFFVPCFGPGYDDTTIRPWNGENRRDRRRGEYFRDMWKHVTGIKSPSVEAVAVTSYNEWAEGTMIEPTKDDGGLYMDILRSFQWKLE